MSFIYSLALVEASSLVNCLDTDASAPSSGSLTPKPCLWHDKTMEVSRLSRFGMTCEPLTESRGAELLTLWLAGFRARTSAQQEKEPESTEPDLECGTTWRGWLAKYDPDSSSWKTAQCSLLEDLNESLATLPRSGMTRGGMLWELPMLELTTSGNASGLWLGTPIAAMAKNTIRSAEFLKGRAPSPQEFVVRWPTPTASQARSEGMILQMRTLVDQGKLTVLEAESMIAGSLTPKRMKPWPTPRSSDKNDTPTLAAQAGGSLNPEWVEWLMGWPIGHTDLKQSGTVKCLCALQQHGVF